MLDDNDPEARALLALLSLLAIAVFMFMASITYPPEAYGRLLRSRQWDFGLLSAQLSDLFTWQRPSDYEHCVLSQRFVPMRVGGWTTSVPDPSSEQRVVQPILIKPRLTDCGELSTDRRRPPPWREHPFQNLWRSHSYTPPFGSQEE